MPHHLFRLISWRIATPGKAVFGFPCRFAARPALAEATASIYMNTGDTNHSNYRLKQSLNGKQSSLQTDYKPGTAYSLRHVAARMPPYAFVRVIDREGLVNNLRRALLICAYSTGTAALTWLGLLTD